MPIGFDLLLPFLVASVLVTVIPGADMALVTRQVFVGGTALAQRTIFGNLTGLLVHGAALAAGLSALVVASATAYTAVKLAGAAYLVYLGVQALLASRQPPTEAPPEAIAAPRRAFLAGLISTVLNPKPALFFLTFLPQFVNRDAAVLPQTLTLVGIHVIVGLIWLSVYAHLVQRARGVLTTPRVKTWLERTTGAVLIAFGLRVAVERRKPSTTVRSSRAGDAPIRGLTRTSARWRSSPKLLLRPLRTPAHDPCLSHSRGGCNRARSVLASLDDMQGRARGVLDVIEHASKDRPPCSTARGLFL